MVQALQGQMHVKEVEMERRLKEQREDQLGMVQGNIEEK